MLYGSTAAIRRKVRAEGHWWAREYLKTGAFPQPMHSGAELDLNRPRWWMHLFVGVFMGLEEGVPEEEHQRMRDAFESLGQRVGAALASALRR
jgi:hypothetical protein